jgi:hypothetical protein
LAGCSIAPKFVAAKEGEAIKALIFLSIAILIFLLASIHLHAQDERRESVLVEAKLLGPQKEKSPYKVEK